MIYVLVPAYNEAPTVGLLLWKVRQVFTAFPREYQLLVVDDASTDGTDEILAPYARALPLTVVTHRERRGYARSLEELMRLAVARTDKPRRDIAVVLQADFSDSPDDIPELVRRIESGADLALADYRRREGQGWREKLVRRLLPLALRRAARGFDGRLDWVSTLKAARLVALARLVSERGRAALLAADGWAADAELLLAAAPHARRVDAVPVKTAALPRRRPSRARPFAAAWAAWRLARSPRPAAGPPPESEPRPARPGRSRRGRRGRRAPARPTEPVPSP
jgi:Glycosyl transferase family 2